VEGESSKPASTRTGAVFLSYASQDADAAQRICEALRAAGIEVWFDQSELRGGDAWDQSIRKQIKSCVLFIPVISRHTHERAEGYFRLEWKLAVDRSHLIMANKAFLVPVVVDDTADDDENVPDKFREVQWTRLPAGQTPPEFVQRIVQLLAGVSATLARAPVAVASTKLSRFRPDWLAVTAVIVAVAAYLLVEKPWVAKSVAFAPPAHSIAVLPFVNLSGDKEQEYFSDGLTEELLNSLAAIEGLQVAARTSSFSFKEHPDIGTVARKLNVGAVLEGSVRRSGNTVRITTQLINAVTGFHLWSKTYDRELSDVLKLQTEIATTVASSLRVTLVGDVSAKIELGGTRNPAAFDAYLRASRAYWNGTGKQHLQNAISLYTEAIRLDPSYALAFADRSNAFVYVAGNYMSGRDIRATYDKALADAREALRLAPGLAEGHLALARYLVDGSLDFSQASAEYERAVALAPGDARVLRNYGAFAAQMGRSAEGLAAARRAVMLDPLNPLSHQQLGHALLFARRYSEALAAYKDGLALNPEDAEFGVFLGLGYYLLGDFESARAACEAHPEFRVSGLCLAMTYEKLGRHTQAEAELGKMKASSGDAAAYKYARIYAQWGNTKQSLEWLDTALRLRDSDLFALKTDPWLDPLRKEPRFQAVERALKFPD
jgi:TolB-like protein